MSKSNAMYFKDDHKMHGNVTALVKNPSTILTSICEKSENANLENSAQKLFGKNKSKIMVISPDVDQNEHFRGYMVTRNLSPEYNDLDCLKTKKKSKKKILTRLDPKGQKAVLKNKKNGMFGGMMKSQTLVENEHLYDAIDEDETPLHIPHNKNTVNHNRRPSKSIITNPRTSITSQQFHHEQRMIQKYIYIVLQAHMSTFKAAFKNRNFIQCMNYISEMQLLAVELNSQKIFYKVLFFLSDLFLCFGNSDGAFAI